MFESEGNMSNNYECFLCRCKFDNEKSAISHLKLNHFIRDNTVEIKCLLNCDEVFYKFDQLKKHLKKCASRRVKVNPFQDENRATFFKGSDSEFKVFSIENVRNHTTQLCFVFISGT